MSPRLSTACSPDHNLRFSYCRELDVVIAKSQWSLETHDSVVACYAEYEEYFHLHFPGRRVDIIFDLSEFCVSAGMASEFTRMRASIIRNFGRLTYRVGIRNAARVAMLMSNALYGLPTNECSSVETALDVLLEDRKRLAEIGHDLEAAYGVTDQTESNPAISRCGSAGEFADAKLPSARDRWTIVDSFERGGRRYVLAKEAAADAPGITLLSEREREAVIQALAGQHNKAIAYDLGLAPSTVRVLMQRAAAKVGAHSRKELLDKVGAILGTRDSSRQA